MSKNFKKFIYPEILFKNAQEKPELRAQWWFEKKNEKFLTYFELLEKVKKISSGLIYLGFNKGDRAALFSPTGPMWLWADAGIICAGGISVCIYPTLSSGELLSQINDSGAKIIFVYDELMCEKIKAIWGEAKKLEKIVLLSGVDFFEDDNLITLKTLMNHGKDLIDLDPKAFEETINSIVSNDLMTIIYTSGTTGKPKGVVHTHKGFCSAVQRDISMIPKMNEGEVLLSVLPLAHTFERQCGHGVAMASQMTIAYTTPMTFTEDIVFFKPAMFMAVPRIFKRIYKEIKDRSASSFVRAVFFNSGKKTALKVLGKNIDKDGFIDLSENRRLEKQAGFFLKWKYRFFDKILYSKIRKIFGGRLRFCFSASATLPAEVCCFFASCHVRVLEGYGSTETFNTVTLNPINKICPGTVGTSCNGVSSKISDEGEYLVKGDNIFLRYWNNKSETSASFTEDGFFKTGDIVEKMDNGYLKIIDRKKGLIVLDTGKIVPSAKIESLFSLSTFIEMAVPFGNDQKILTALVIPNFDAVIKYFEKKKIPFEKNNLLYDKGICVEVDRSFINNEAFLELIEKEVTDANLKLESWEKIKKYYISSRWLTEQSGELTPTFKVKKNVVLKNFQTEIESLYL
jgi:long-chain acyl-CoA synthetase